LSTTWYNEKGNKCCTFKHKKMKNLGFFLVMITAMLFVTACEKPADTPEPKNPVGEVNPPAVDTVVVPPIVPKNISSVIFQDSLTQTNVSMTFTQGKGDVFADKRNKVCFFTVSNLPEGWKIEALSMSFEVEMGYGKKIANFFEKDSVSFESFSRSFRTSTPSVYKQDFSVEFTENRDFFIEIHTKNFKEDHMGVIFMAGIFKVKDQNNEVIVSKVMRYSSTGETRDPREFELLLFKKKN